MSQNITNENIWDESILSYQAPPPPEGKEQATIERWMQYQEIQRKHLLALHAELKENGFSVKGTFNHDFIVSHEDGSAFPDQHTGSA